MSGTRLVEPRASRSCDIRDITPLSVCRSCSLLVFSAVSLQLASHEGRRRRHLTNLASRLYLRTAFDMNNHPPPYAPYRAANGPGRQVIVIPRQAIYAAGPPPPQKSCLHRCGLVCISPCLWIGCMFGLWPKMKRVHRILIASFTIVGIAVTAAVLLATVTYGKNDFAPSPSDMRPLDEKFSTSLCDRFSVNSASSPVDVYFFDAVPPIRRNYTENYLINTDPQSIDEKHYEVISFYMLKGSKLEANVHAGPNVLVYLIKGSYNFGEWQGDRDCCYLQKQTVSLVFGADLKHDIDETDLYYVTIAPESYYGLFGTGSTTVSAKFLLQKTVYDLRGNKLMCANFSDSKKDGECASDLSYGSEQVAVVYASGNGGVKSYSVKTTCHARFAIYIPCFMLVPLVFLGLWTTMLWLCFKNKSANQSGQPGTVISRNHAEDPQVTGDKAELVTNQII